MLDPASGSPNASLLYDIKGARAFHQDQTPDPSSVGVQALDDLTLEVELEGPTGYFLSLLAHYATYPVPRHVLEAHGEAWTETSKIVTNGAFKLESWKRGESMVMTHNPEYHGRFRGNLQRVELSCDVDWSAQLEIFEAGNLDTLNLRGLPPLERARAHRRHAGEYVSAPLLGTFYAGFDVARPPFDDPRVRRAFALATDKKTLANQVLKGYEFPATGGFVPSGIPGHSAGIGLPYDPEQARQLLAEAGYPGGRGFPIVEAWTWQRMKPRVEYLQAQWQESLGVEIAWEVMEFSQFLERVDRAPAHIFQGLWVPDYPDPDACLRASPLRRRTHWRNETYDELVEKARRVLDQGERLGLYAQADRILIEDAAVMPLTYMWSHVLVKPWVRKFPSSAPNQWLWKDIVIEAH
jgi:oligopeptide transport system substrate-binding protein